MIQLEIYLLGIDKKYIYIPGTVCTMTLSYFRADPRTADP